VVALIDLDKLHDVTSVEVVLLGGLGNQLFQYASARSLALELGLDSLKLNVGLLKPALHNLAGLTGRSLEVTELLESHAPYTILDGISARASGLSLVARKKFSPRAGNINPMLGDDLSQVRRIGGTVRLLGTFQRLDYFQSNARSIQKDFNIFPENGSSAAGRAQEIASTNSLAVHIRRGDYVGNHRHTLLGLGYYRKAIAKALRERDVDNILFFSDDPEWLQNQPITRCGSIISGEKWSSIEEFQLMTAANHFIIANSTYSWWAAWLGKRQDKAVFFPTRWKHSLSAEPEGLIPGDWVPVSADDH